MLHQPQSILLPTLNTDHAKLNGIYVSSECAKCHNSFEKSEVSNKAPRKLQCGMYCTQLHSHTHNSYTHTIHTLYTHITHTHTHIYIIYTHYIHIYIHCTQSLYTHCVHNLDSACIAQHINTCIEYALLLTGHSFCGSCVANQLKHTDDSNDNDHHMKDNTHILT